MEYKNQCKTCGKVYCYTDADLKKNTQNSAMSAISAIGGIASIFGGTIFHTAHLNNQTQKYSDKIVDYTKCPYCNSRNVVPISDAEYSKIAKNMGSGVVSSKKVEVSANATPESLIKRSELFLEDGEWDYADAYADSCLDAEPENAYAYTCKLMAELRVKKLDELAECRKPFDDNDNYKKAVRFANEELKVKLNGYIVHINERNKNEELTLVYISASEQMDSAKTEAEFIAAAEVLATIPGFKDSDEKQKLCYIKADEVRKNSIYNDAKTKMGSGIVSQMEEALKLFETIDDWEDCKNQIKICNEKIEKQKVEDKRKGKMYLIISAASVVAITIVALIFNFVIEPNSKYNSAVQLSQNGEYVEAISIFSNLGGYKDSGDKVIENKEKLYAEAITNFSQGEYDSAIASFSALGDFKDSNTKIIEIKDALYNNAIDLLNEKKYEESFLAFRRIHGYKDANEYIQRFVVKYDSMVLIKYPNSEYSREGESEHNVYDSNGYLIESTRKYGDSNEYTEVIKYKNDLSGRCLQENSVTTTSENPEYKWLNTDYYDHNDKIVKQTSDYGNGLSTAIYEYTYDQNNNCIKKICKYDDGDVVTTEYTYDKVGNCVKEVYGWSDTDTYNHSIIRTYNDEGQLIQEIYKERGTEKISTYNEFGDCVYFEYDYVKSEDSYKEERIYNQFGDCIKTVKTMNNGSVITTEYLYDEYGRKLKYGSNLDEPTEIDGEYTYNGIRITFK